MGSTFCRHKVADLWDLLGWDPDDPISIEIERAYPGVRWVSVRWSEWGEWEAERTGGGPDDWAPGWEEVRGREVDWLTVRYRDGSEESPDLATLAERCPLLAARAREVSRA